MNSHLLQGRVRHKRLRPFTYELDHAVWYAALDLEELDEALASVRLISRNRRNVLEFRDSDFLPEPAVDLAADLVAHLRSAGVDPGAYRITLVTNLRTLGYVFNPASFYLCRDEDGAIRIVVVEVHNTHGERHLYTLRADPEIDGRFSAGMAKDFYVSPFIEMEGRYVVHVRDSGDRLSIAINQQDAQAPLLTTSLVLRKQRLTDRTLLGLLIRHPLLTHRTIGLIHWHAIRLWLKGARFHRHGEAKQNHAARQLAGRTGEPAAPTGGAR